MEGNRNRRIILSILKGLFLWGVVCGLALFPESDNRALRPVGLLCVDVGEPVRSVRRSVGTGVVFQTGSDGIWVATAAHVLDNKSDEDLVTLIADGIEIPCETWVMAGSGDLAFLYIPWTSAIRRSRIEWQKPMTDKACYDTLESGALVVASGYCSGEVEEYQGELLESWIYVEDFEQYLLLAKCEVRHGMSGGGLYDDDGHLIGMICGGNDEGELVAVPLHVMQARFEEILAKP